MKNSLKGIIDYEWKGSPTRIRMPLEQRAKIFKAFTPLEGYSELLREVEEEALQRFEGTKNKEDN